MNSNMPFTTEALQYGILGIVALLLGYFAWSQWQRLERKNLELEKKVDRLQSEIIEIMGEERDRMATLVQDNTKAIQELSRIILEYIVK
jgi:signal transduction histidine kinase